MHTTPTAGRDTVPTGTRAPPHRRSRRSHRSRRVRRTSSRAGTARRSATSVRGAASVRPGRGRHRGRGARRGDVRAAVLALLTERPMHGYEIIQQIEERSGGVWRPSPGSIYPSLQLLADEGLVTGDESGGRRLFTLTDAGREEAARHEGGSPFDQERDETFEVAHRFREEMGQLAMAVWQVAQAGTEAQRTEILDVLADARRRAYQLLADGTPTPPEPPVAACAARPAGPAGAVTAPGRLGSPARH